jgi:hypothetical protein
MKNPQAHLSNENAQKQLKQFLLFGWIIAAVAFVAVGLAAIASLAFGARCIALSWHKANASKPNGKWLKVASIALIIVSFLELIAVYSAE